jgi:hypothetical protein
MKNIKKMLTAATLMMVLMVGTSFGGVIVHANETPQPCTAETTKEKAGVILSDMTGVIVHFTGVIVHATTGVIVHVSRTEAPVDCGVIVH